MVYFSTFDQDKTISLFQVKFSTSSGFFTSGSNVVKLKMSNPQYGLTIGGVHFSRYAFLGKYFLIDNTKGGLNCFKDFSPANLFTFITTSTFADTRESDSCLTLDHFSRNYYYEILSRWTNSGKRNFLTSIPGNYN